MHNYKSNSDEDLVIKMQSGDKMALAILVRRFHKLFCDKAYWLVKDKDASKDIAQDCWSIIIKKINSLKAPKQFKYWAIRIVINKSNDWLRLQTKNYKYNIDYDIEIESSTELHTENENLKVLLLKEINNLPIKQKQVVRLFYLEELSLKQISEILNISIGTAKSRLFYAREKLKTILKHSNYER